MRKSIYEMLGLYEPKNLNQIQFKKPVSGTKTGLNVTDTQGKI